MAIECVETQEWIEEEVWKPFDEWVETQQKKCKNYPWYDPRGWVCWFVTVLAQVVVWILVKVGKWVVRTVCKIVGAIWTFLRDVFLGLFNILAGIFTWDWCRALHGFIQTGGGIVDPILTGGRIVTGLDALDYIVTEIQRSKLRTYIRTKLGFKYGGEPLREIIENLGLDRGAFGYRINMRAARVFLDSETLSPTVPNTLNLLALKDGGINVRELCGFEATEGCFNRKRFKTLKKGLHAGGGGGNEIDNPISEEELELYLSSRGADGPKFIILPMRDAVLDTKLRAAETKGREIGLIPQFKKELIEVLHPQHVVQSENLSGTELVEFLVDPVGRKRKVRDLSQMNKPIVDQTEAIADLCTPTVVGIFRYEDDSTLRGLSACLMGSACEPSVGAHDASGATFIDNQPDIAWKYVPIHELGHWFGLCHVQGIENIMYTPKGGRGEPNGFWDKVGRSVTWYTPKLFFLTGEPTFTLDEAMQVWDYIIEHFPMTCLGADQRWLPPPGPDVGPVFL
jgi:hypothetical protein